VKVKNHDHFIDFTYAKDKMLAYTRSDENNEVIVIFNLHSSSKLFKLPEGKTYTGILGNSEKVENEFEIEPLSAFVGKLDN
jgi:hypothetical protein